MYEILLERSAERDLRRLSAEVNDRVIVAIQALSTNPRPPGSRKLKGGDHDWRIRVGDHRVLYEIADAIGRKFTANRSPMWAGCRGADTLSALRITSARPPFPPCPPPRVAPPSSPSRSSAK